MLLSIIIPTYNSSRFLPACLDSILDMGMPPGDFEIIVVNDGSTDDSLHVAQAYGEKYPQLKVLSQNNQGPSSARNTGLAAARGSYVWFVDADDEIGVDAARAVAAIRERDEIDILGIILQEIDEHKRPIKFACNQPTVPHGKILSGRDAVLMGYTPSSACALIMSRSFLLANDLKFKEGITHEDVEFTYRAMVKACTVLFSDWVAYFYYRRGDTRSTPHDDVRLLKYILDDVEVALSFRRLASENRDDSQLYHTIYRRYKNTVFGLVLSLRRNRKEWCGRGINERVLDELKMYQLYPLKKPFYSWKKAIVAKFLNQEFFLRL